MSCTTTLFLALGGWILFIAAWRWFVLPRMRSGPASDPVTFVSWLALKLYGRVMHRAVYLGTDIVPDTNTFGPLIVVSNHTGSIDPLLIQAACRFEVRWMMATEMMTDLLDWVWRRHRLIPVDRDGTDLGPVREALRELRDGGVVGIFPEGRIVNPPRQIWPFFNGVGLIISRSRAPVLLVWVSGTPAVTTMFGSITTRSNARIEFLEMIQYDEKMEPGAITADLRRRLHDASGWPLNDNPPPPQPKPDDPFNG